MSEISLGRGTILLLVSRAAGYGLAFVNSIILARALGADRLGAYAYAMGLAALFGLLPNFGIYPLVARTIAQQPGAGPGMLSVALRAQALLAVAVLVAIPSFSAMLPSQPVPVWYIGLAALQLALGTLSWPYLAVLSGRVRYDRLATAELVAGIVGTVLLLLAVAFHGGVAAVLTAHVLGAGIAVLVSQKAAQPLLVESGVAPTVGIGTLLRQAAPFGAVAAVQSLYARLDILLLGQIASTLALGLYSIAYKPTIMLVGFGSTVAVALYPLMARTLQPMAPIQFQRAMRGLATVGPAMALIFSGLAGPMLHLLYGSEYVAAAPVLVVLAWSAAVNWLYSPLGVTLQARGYERRWLAILICGLALNFGGNLWAIPRWGALGAATATLVSEVALLLITVVLVGRTLKIFPSFKPVFVGIGATVAGCAVLWLLQAQGSLPGTVAALMVYGGILVLFKVVTGEDATMMIGWIRQAVPGCSRG